MFKSIGPAYENHPESGTFVDVRIDYPQVGYEIEFRRYAREMCEVRVYTVDAREIDWFVNSLKQLGAKWTPYVSSFSGDLRCTLATYFDKEHPNGH
jgi:hypothetical protein